MKSLLKSAFGTRKEAMSSLKRAQSTLAAAHFLPPLEKLFAMKAALDTLEAVVGIKVLEKTADQPSLEQGIEELSARIAALK